MVEQRQEFSQRSYHPDMFHEPDVDGICWVDNRKLLESWFIPANEQLDVASYSIEWDVNVKPEETVDFINNMLTEYEHMAPHETQQINKRYQSYFPNLDPKEPERIVKMQQYVPHKGDEKLSRFKTSYLVYEKPLNKKQILNWIDKKAYSFLFYTSCGSISWQVEEQTISVYLDRVLPTDPLKKFIELTTSARISQKIASDFIDAVIEQVDKYKYSR